MLKELLVEFRKSSFSVLPVYFLISLLSLTKVVNFTGNEFLSFSLATIILILGITLFNYGAEHAMTPIGKMVGKGLTKQGKAAILFLVVFLFGFLITIAEPDLSVLASQTQSVFPKILLIAAIGLSVGMFLLLAVLKILKKINLIRILSFLYMVAFAIVGLLVFQNKEAMVALSFDSGGVTTGPMTVPFLMALGTGSAAILAQKSEKDASFGFIAFSSIGPVITMLILSLFAKGNIQYALPDYLVADNFFLAFLHCFLEQLKLVGLSIALLFVCFIVIDLLFLRLDKKTVLLLIRGLLISYLGLSLFLASAECAYMAIGFKIGAQLSESPTWVLILISFVIGALTVLAEPAIKILTTQVEEITNGLIKKRSMLIALAIGVGVAISLATLRTVLKFSILYIVIPGYIVCFALSFFVPKIYTAIAFDAGGVASGPLTSSFILPLALGLCSKTCGAEEVLNYGFGVVSLVALSPLISIEVLGVFSVFSNKRKVRKSIKQVLKKDDKMIIHFGDRYEGQH